MAKREKYGVKLVCECGATGTAIVSEFENPVFEKDPNRVLEESSDQFDWVSGGTWAEGAAFKCKSCGKQVPAS